MRNFILFFMLCFIFSCHSSKSLVSTSEDVARMPGCLQEIIKTMSEDQYEGMPLSITQFNYQGQKVYYMVAPCCDKFNIVYDSACTILGYPDGGLTGRGDGKMLNFEKEATGAKVIWEVKNVREEPASANKN